MATLIDCIINFLRVRQLNIAIAALLTIGYFVYQYRKVIFKLEDDDGLRRRCSRTISRSRSKSRSRSRSNYKLADMKRRGRKPTRRCPDCSLCNYDE
ncbi:uncharacterized protein LOC126779711 [Nymphalis io]|uniref:uncharacterized protein LOC126779711 n=1 Tax=Inachis io TaxID=171585 RepID=UPI002169FCFA|nr:uncharacterized protein LOC126779711 [Nymphalis io]